MAQLAHPLFAGIALNEEYPSLRAKALSAVDSLPSEVLLTADLPRLRQQLVNTYRFDPLHLEWDDPSSCPGDGGATIQVFVRFTGAPGLFGMTPTRTDGPHPTGWVRERALVLVVPADQDSAHREFDRQRALIDEWVARVNADAELLNRRLAKVIRTRVTSDANRLRASTDLAREFGPPPPRRGPTGADSSRGRRATPADHAGDVGPPAGTGGRPRGSRAYNLERYEEALAATPEPRTSKAIAARLRTMDGRIGVGVRQLRRIVGHIRSDPE